MVQHSTFWFETFPPDYRLSTGLPKKADVVIIGAGVIGVSALFNLLNLDKNADVVVLDEGPVSSRASGRASGQLTMMAGKPFHVLAKEVGKGNAALYARFMERNVRYMQRIAKVFKLDCGLNQSGGLRLAVNDEEVEALKAEQKALEQYTPSIKTVWLNEGEIQALLPSEYFLGGLYIPIEATLNPYAYVCDLAAKIELSGRRILTGCSVESVERVNDELRVTVRNKGTIRTSHVVYCTNAYSAELLPEFRDVVTPVRGQMMATEPLADEMTQLIPEYSMSCNGCSEYFRMHDGRLLFGGMRHAVRDQQRGILFDGETSPTISRKLREFAQSAFPFLQTRIANVWTGIMCETQDSLPIIGQRPGKPNEWVCAGFNGLGVSHSLLSGRVIAEHIVKGKTSFDVAKMFDPGRFCGE